MSRCRESAGFLFDHPCSNVAEGHCTKCAKPICAEHTRDGECVACRRQERTKVEGAENDPLLVSSVYYSDYDQLSQYDAYSKRDKEAFQATEGEGEWDKDWDADFDGS